MDEDGSAHYALKIAVSILRERCQLFQRRITALEEENLNLKLLCQRNTSSQDSSSQIDSLKRHIASVEEQNSQLQSKMKIIAQENQQLWTNLGKLTCVNKSLGSHLNKINDTLSQHVIHQPLIRSKTFTQSKPETGLQENFEANDNRKLDLEDISLKLINSMSEVKNEMDSLVQDMTDVEILDNLITSSLGFSYEDENEDIIEDLKIILEELNYVKGESEKQNVILKENLKNIKIMKEYSKCDKCYKMDDEDKLNSSQTSNNIQRYEKSITQNNGDKICPTIRKMCPVCSYQFAEEIPFSLFVSHVESHFKSAVNDV